MDKKKIDEEKRKTIDERIDGMMSDSSAQTKAVSSLIEVTPRKKGAFGSDIELKTDLSDKNICLHTRASIMGHILEMKEEDFGEFPLLGKLVEIKERKLLSKDRKSRAEIVDVARNPDMSFNQDHATGGFVRKLFTSRKNKDMQR